MIRRLALLLTVGLTLFGASPVLAQLPGVQLDDQTPTAARAPEDIIREQLRAFNAHDPAAMVANLHERFAWFAIDSDVMRVESEGRGNFFQSMRDYFASVPGARAEIEELFVAGVFVTARERAYWLQGGAELSQASLSIYEIRDGLIYRVWYYPAF